MDNVASQQNTIPTQPNKVSILSRFSITKKEIFLLATAIILLFSVVLQIPISVFNAYDLLLLTILTFLAKGFFTDTHDTPLYFMFTICIFLTLYYRTFHVVLVYLIALGLMKVLKVI